MRKGQPRSFCSDWSIWDLNHCGVYAIVNSVTKESYIGSSRMIQDRIAHIIYGKANEKLQAAIDKYGIDAFEFLVLQKMPRNVSKKVRFIAEAKWQKKLKPEYNIKTLSEDGREPLTLEIKKKISRSNSGKKRTPDEKAARSKWMIGNQRCKGKHWILSVEAKNKMKWDEERRKKYLFQHGSGSESRRRARRTAIKNGTYRKPPRPKGHPDWKKIVAKRKMA